LLPDSLLLGLLFFPEDGGSYFFGNVGALLRNKRRYIQEDGIPVYIFTTKYLDK
jgi:hypothetical protein